MVKYLLTLTMVATAFVILLVSLYSTFPHQNYLPSPHKNPYVVLNPSPSPLPTTTPKHTDQTLTDLEMKKELENWKSYQPDLNDRQWIDGFCSDKYFPVINKGSLKYKTIEDQLVFLTPNYFKWTDNSVKKINQDPNSFICSINTIIPLKAFSDKIIWIQSNCGISGDSHDPTIEKCYAVKQQMRLIYGLFQCPIQSWVDCLPSPNSPTKIQCQPEFLQWAKTNCPNFQGAAL